MVTKKHETIQTLDTTITWSEQLNKFLHKDSGILSAPSEFSWQIVGEFLAAIRTYKTGLGNLPAFHSSCRCLYDRIYAEEVLPIQKDVVNATVNEYEKQDSLLQQSRALSKKYLRREREVLNDQQLFACLNSASKEQETRRTVILITDISPLCAAILAVKEDDLYSGEMRAYLQSHLDGEIEFSTIYLKEPHNCTDDNFPRHVAARCKFRLEFHLPYMALRCQNQAGSDPRGVRHWTPLIEPFAAVDEAVVQRSLACYEAQVSLIILGDDDQRWKAYCNIDTWHGSHESAEKYLADKLDGPAGDGRAAEEPCINPREYFLLVLSVRMRQISNEWGNVATHVLQRLAAYETQYLQTIDHAQLHDDQSMTRTRSYSKAASSLRQYHDVLSTTLDRLQVFMNSDHGLLDKHDEFEDQCGCYLTCIEIQVNHLIRVRQKFFQSMQRFESMRDGLLTASVLRESRQATTQSKDIGLLTKVTVAYLPFSLASGIFGISSTIPGSGIWLYWTALSITLTIITTLIAFRSELLGWIRQVFEGHRDAKGEVA